MSVGKLMGSDYSVSKKTERLFWGYCEITVPREGELVEIKVLFKAKCRENDSGGDLIVR